MISSWIFVLGFPEKALRPAWVYFRPAPPQDENESGLDFRPGLGRDSGSLCSYRGEEPASLASSWRNFQPGDFRPGRLSSWMIFVLADSRPTTSWSIFVLKPGLELIPVW